MDLSGWMADAHLPAPVWYPKRWDHGEPYAVFHARREWSRALRQRGPVHGSGRAT